MVEHWWIIMEYTQVVPVNIWWWWKTLMKVEYFGESFWILQEAQALLTLRNKATFHQVTTLLANSENVLFPGHNHLLTTGTDDPSLAGSWAIIKMSGHQHRW